MARDPDDTVPGLEALRGAEVLRRIPCTLLAVDARGRLAYANEAGVRLLGLRRETLHARSLSSCVVVEHRPRLKQALARSRLARGHSLVECDVGTSGSGSRWVEFEITAQQDPKDGWLLVGRGLRERRALRGAVARQEDALRETLASLLDTLPVGILIADNEGQPRLANRAAHDLLGMHALTPLGRWAAAGMLRRPDGGLARDEDLPCLATMRDGQPRRDVELEVLRSDLEPVPVLLNTDALRDAKGRIVEICCTFTDISERRHIERQLQHAQKMEAVGILAGGIAHDFNNILCAINGYTGLAQRHVNGHARMGRLLGEIQQAGARGATLTGQLLRFSREEAFAPQVLDLDVTVRGMRTMLSRLMGADVRLCPDLRAADGAIKADPGQVEQVLLNLVINASDAMPAGGLVTVRTDVVDARRVPAELAAAGVPGRYVVLSVVDEGCGMDEETRERVFEPFFTTKPRGKGTGLGLSTVYGIVKQSGGFIEIESAPEHGSTFRVFWPCVDAPATRVAASALQEAQARRGETILLVEDEEMVRRLIREILVAAGFEVLEAANGREALEVSTDYLDRIDLLVTDVVMPELNGRRLAERLRARKPGLRVLFVSGYSDGALASDHALASDAAFLPKPFEPRTLTATVRELLDREPREPRRDASPPA